MFSHSIVASLSLTPTELSAPLEKNVTFSTHSTPRTLTLAFAPDSSSKQKDGKKTNFERLQLSSSQRKEKAKSATTSPLTSSSSKVSFSPEDTSTTSPRTKSQSSSPQSSRLSSPGGTVLSRHERSASSPEKKENGVDTASARIKNGEKEIDGVSTHQSEDEEKGRERRVLRRSHTSSKSMPRTLAALTNFFLFQPSSLSPGRLPRSSLSNPSQIPSRTNCH